MGALKTINMCICLVTFLVHMTEAVVFIHFDQAPPPQTRLSTAIYKYSVIDSYGKNPCVDNVCFTYCELDGEPLEPCPIGIIKLRNLTQNHDHNFRLNVTTSNGERNSSSYYWFIDTVPPTARLATERSFTNAGGISIDITFSEPCPGKGGFKCPNASNCNVIVNGPASVDTSTLQEIEPHIKYRVAIAFSTSNVYGRVVVRMADNFCTDKAGNPFTRSNDSIAILHFDRRPVHADIWTLVPSYELEISRVTRTVLATNQTEDLKIYLEFSDPVLNSTSDILTALAVSVGYLVPIHSASHVNRRFGFELKNVSGTQILTVKLETFSLIGRSGTHVSPVKPIVLLYDSTKPSVRLSTSSTEVTKKPIINVIVEFTKPVFGFDSSIVAVQGGVLARFKELSKALYLLSILVEQGNVLSVCVPEGKVNDIAGNLNLASNHLQVKHYSAPAISVALHSFVTAGLLATSLAASILALSAANLAALGDQTSKHSNLMFSDPSRNLLGTAGHLQVFVFSNWFSVNLPIEYSETTNGLRWLIPREKLPWSKEDALVWPHYHSTYEGPNKLSIGNGGLFQNRINSSCISSLLQPRMPTDAVGMPILPIDHGLQIVPDEKFTSSYQNPCALEDARLYKQHKPSMKDDPYGLPLEYFEYFVYFLRGEPLSAANVVQRMENYTGWEDFKMNMFWLAMAGGSLLAIHMLILIFLRWRTGTSVNGILSIPRFELFLLILFLPSICQSAAFVIRGGTTEGIITGALLLAIPAAFLLSLSLFLVVAIFLRSFVQYKEIEPSDENSPWHTNLCLFFTGRTTNGKWVHKEGLPFSFIPRFGILFEDRKGPPVFVRPGQNDPSHLPEWTDSGQSGIGRMRAITSDESYGESTIPAYERLLGCGRSFYIVLDLLRRAGLGVIAGAYSSRENSTCQSQLIIAFIFTVVQFLYLFIFKPYLRRGFQLVESVSLICEAGVFGLSFYIDHWDMYKNQRTIGRVMLALLFTSFASQLMNEWYALIKCLLLLPQTQKPSLKLGLKWVLKGLILPLLPKKHWARLVPGSTQPKTGLAPVVPLSPETESERRNVGVSSMTATVVPVYSPGSPELTDPRGVIASTAQIGVGATTNVGLVSQNGFTSNKRSRTRIMEEKRPKGLKLEPKDEMKKLQKLAMASFARSRQGGGEASSSYAARELCSDDSVSDDSARH